MVDIHEEEILDDGNCKVIARSDNTFLMRCRSNEILFDDTHINFFSGILDLIKDMKKKK